MWSEGATRIIGSSFVSDCIYFTDTKTAGAVFFAIGSDKTIGCL